MRNTETKLNQRVLLTKEMIHRAFLKLLQEKSIHRIAIRELCERAGINRTTFYNHYGSQYEVLSEIADSYLSDIDRTMESVELKNREDVHSRVTLVLQYMEDNLSLSRLLLHSDLGEDFVPRLFSLPKIENLLDEALRDVADEQARRAAMDFAIYGSYKLLQDWIAEDRRISAEDEARLILQLARRVCRESA